MKKEALKRAKRNAVENYEGFMQVTPKIENLKLADEIITSLTAYIYDIKTEKDWKENKEICIQMNAKINPMEADKHIRSRIEKGSRSQSPAPLFDVLSAISEEESNKIIVASDPKHRISKFEISGPRKKELPQPTPGGNLGLPPYSKIRTPKRIIDIQHPF